MTDLATKPEPAAGDGDDTTPIDAPVEWAPAEPEPKKKRLGLWLGIPGGLIVAGAVAASLILIAPGVVAAGVDVGWRTPGAATEAIAEGIDGTTITLQTPTGDVSFTGEELGATVDAASAAEDVFGDHPLWNVGAWNPGDVPLDVTLDAETALAAIEEKAPDLFTAPVDAQVAYDGGSGQYTFVEDRAGSGVDVDALSAAVSAAFAEGGSSVTVSPETVPVEAAVTTASAQAQADALNALVADAGFYVDGERIAGVDAEQAASWVSVSTTDDGFEIAVDEDAVVAAVADTVASLPEKVNRDVVNEQIVTNSNGDHLRTVTEGQDGWGLDSTDGVAEAFAASLAEGQGAYELPVEEIPYETDLLYRRIEVDKSAGTTTLFETVNDGDEQAVDTYLVAFGTPGHDTQEGHFTVYGQLTQQNMGSCDDQGNYVPGGKFDYCTANVPWVTYFNGDQGFHGTYWHSNFGPGAFMSHGCVNMTIDAAERVYYFAQTGTEIWVHA